MTILKRDDGVPYGFIVDISLSRLYKTIAEVPGLIFTDKRRFFWSSEDIHAEFTFKEHTYSVDPDPWEDGYWIVPKDKDATYPEIDEIRQHIETRFECQQCSHLTPIRLRLRGLVAADVGSERMNRIAAIIVVMITAYACAGHPPADFELAETTYSPQRTFEVEHYVYSGTNMPAHCNWQHWISDGAKERRKYLLYESDVSVETMISLNDAYIVLNDRLGSTDRVALLFGRGRGGMFGLATNVDLRAEAFHAAALEQGYAPSLVFEHSYCEASCWLGTHALILHAWGHADSGTGLLKDWYCIYDIKIGRASFDLTTVNNGAFQGDLPQRMTEKASPGGQPRAPRNHRSPSAPVVRGR